MSKASAIGTVVFIEQAGVYMPLLQCNYGDLYQEFQGDSSTPTNITPDFPSTKPVISFILTSSRAAEGLVSPNFVEWSFNGVTLEFLDGLSTNTFGGESGHFEFVDKSANGGYYGLRVVRNLVKASDGAACTITAKATISVGNTSDEIQQVYSIPITKSVGNQKHVTIIAGDSKYFTLTDKDTSCALKAVARMGSDEITSDLSYKWYKLVDGLWTQIVTATASTLVVTSSMVDTTGIFKVEIFQSGIMIGQDVQSVVDASDPFDIIVGADPEDKCIRNPGDIVKLTPILVKRGSTSKYMDIDFYFTLMDPAGIILNVGQNGTPLKSYDVTFGHCQQAGGSVTYTIMTAD